jgi:hypothetical protein
MTNQCKPDNISGLVPASAPGIPFGKALGIEIVTDQEGESLEGYGGVEFAAGMDGDGQIDSTDNVDHVWRFGVAGTATAAF